MNIDKIIAIGMAECGMSSKQVASEMDISVSRLNQLRKAEQCNTKTLERLAVIFKKNLPDLIASQHRGEDNA